MSKKSLTLLLLLAFTLLLTPAGVFAEVDYYDYYKSVELGIGKDVAYVNETSVYIDQVPYINSGRTMVPLRFISETLDCNVEWLAATRTVYITNENGTVIKVPVGSKTAYVNNSAKTLDAPAEIKGGRTFVPLRFVGESLGAGVKYDDKTRTVTVVSIDTSSWDTFIEPSTGMKILYPYDWDIIAAGENLILESPGETWFELTYDTAKVSDILKTNKDKLLSEGWKLVSETTAGLKFSKPDPNVETTTLSYLVSVSKSGSGYLVVTVETNSVTQEQDLTVVDRITPGPGI